MDIDRRDMDVYYFTAMLICFNISKYECLASPSEEWFRFEQSCFHFSENKMYYWDAISYCEYNGGYVAVVNTSQENDYLSSIVSAKGASHWISIENRYSDLSFWDRGEPNSSGNHKCVELTTHQWNDLPCSRLNLAICEDTREPINCGGADVVFVVDTSSSQTKDTVNRQKQFIQEIITYIFDNKTTFQISLITVNFEPTIHFYLNTYTIKESLISAVDNISYDKGPSFTGKALQLIHDEVLQSSNGARLMNTDAFVVVLSDGLSSNPTDTIVRANELKQDGVVIIAIGIGTQICHEELLHIASDSSEVLFAENDDLCNYFLRYQVMDQFLDCYIGTSDVALLVDASSNVNIQYFYNQLDAVRQIVKASSIGNASVQFSYTRFADSVKIEFDFNDHPSTSDVIVAISTPSRLTKYSTVGDIANALKHVAENGFTPSMGHRTDARKFVILFTNGKTENPNDIEEKALTLKESGVVVVTVGMGLDSNVTLLSRIASDPFYAFIIGNDVFTDTNVLTSVIGSFEYDVCDFD